ncbi:hypothetical protein SERLA73DRAFT_68584 [Serpula lacrymans var. lacrymans S7.3]|uniref:Uncharacterized protein n=2 Tax=Serpula lacrymans var. lacrymans TaxID=341189 RepID=F8PH30_SERL3|nr:uncharacterized protein SERLADRAFT_432350 [Serpula lacrymans var. lacrymans S7.9]EGO04926.1 hypothetical protein SERLA73DRAFT_68584 [Serpula lacrymans var. lacrymans S7.3]EGO30732.1 hypothetical protein SERLADRAFT_432350 [Serpula lacrymans var. lacrymans S7.9]
MPIQPAHSESPLVPTTCKQKCNISRMPIVLSKKAKRAAPSRRSPSLPPVPGPSRPFCLPHTCPGPKASGGQRPDPVAPPTSKGKGKMVVEITRGVEDLQRKSMEEGCKRCRLDQSACTISRSKQTKKWRTSCNKCSRGSTSASGTMMQARSWKPEVSRALVAAPNHPIKIGLPRGAPKLVYQPHGTTGTQFTIRVPPPSRAVVVAPAHHTSLPASRPSHPLPPLQAPAPSQESRRPPQGDGC